MKAVEHEISVRKMLYDLALNDLRSESSQLIFEVETSLAALCTLVVMGEKC